MKLARQSPLAQVRGGKSGLHRAGWRLTAVRWKPQGIRRGIGPQRRVCRKADVKRGNLHLQQDQIGWQQAWLALPAGRLLERMSNCAPRWMTVTCNKSRQNPAYRLASFYFALPPLMQFNNIINNTNNLHSVNLISNWFLTCLYLAWKCAKSLSYKEKNLKRACNALFF